jgi:hypothetical protein
MSWSLLKSARGPFPRPASRPWGLGQPGSLVTAPTLDVNHRALWSHLAQLVQALYAWLASRRPTSAPVRPKRRGRSWREAWADERASDRFAQWCQQVERPSCRAFAVILDAWVVNGSLGVTGEEHGSGANGPVESATST